MTDLPTSGSGEIAESRANSIRDQDVLDVILPAGGRIDGPFAAAAGVQNKALMVINGRTLLAAALQALRPLPRIRRIAVIGPAAALEEADRHGTDLCVGEGESGPENIFRGLDALSAEQGAAPRVVIATTDLPFLTAPAVAQFLDACPPDADAVIPVVTEHAFQSRFPGSQNIYVRLADGAFTTGGTFVVSQAAARSNRAHIQQLFEMRKSQWRLAMLIGPRIALRFVTGRLRLDDIVARASRLAACRGVALRDTPPELAFDIDNMEDYTYACHLVENEPRHEREQP